MISTTLRLAAQVEQSLPHQLSLSPLSCGPISRLGHPRWPHRATGPRSSPRTVGSCGFLSGSSSVGSVSSWPSCHSAELPVQHPGVPRSRGHRPSEVVRYAGRRRPRLAQSRSPFGSPVRLHQLAEEPDQDPVLGQHGLVGVRRPFGQTPAG